MGSGLGAIVVSLSFPLMVTVALALATIVTVLATITALSLLASTALARKLLAVDNANVAAIALIEARFGMLMSAEVLASGGAGFGLRAPELAALRLARGRILLAGNATLDVERGARLVGEPRILRRRVSERRKCEKNDDCQNAPRHGGCPTLPFCNGGACPGRLANP